MLIPLAVLALGAIAAGMAFKFNFIGEGAEEFWKGSLIANVKEGIMHDVEEIPAWVHLAPFVMMVVGFLVAYYMYVVDRTVPKRLAEQNPGLYRFLLNKWYFDELYDFLFVRPAFWLGRLFWKGGDGRIIDGLGPDGISARVVDGTNWIVRLQTGYIYHYAFAMLMGVAAFVTWYLFRSGH